MIEVHEKPFYYWFILWNNGFKFHLPHYRKRKRKPFVEEGFLFFVFAIIYARHCNITIKDYRYRDYLANVLLVVYTYFTKSELTALFRARDASCPKGKKMKRCHSYFASLHTHDALSRYATSP